MNQGNMLRTMTADAAIEQVRDEMSAETEKIESALDRLMIGNEAFRLGVEAKSGKPEDSVMMQALLEVRTEDEQLEARYWFGVGLVVSA